MSRPASEAAATFSTASRRHPRPSSPARALHAAQASQPGSGIRPGSVAVLEVSAYLPVGAQTRGVAFSDRIGSAGDTGRLVGRSPRRARRREILFPLLHRCLNQAAPQSATRRAASPGGGASGPSGAVGSRCIGAAPWARASAKSAPASSTRPRVTGSRSAGAQPWLLPITAGAVRTQTARTQKLR